MTLKITYAYTLGYRYLPFTGRIMATEGQKQRVTIY